MKTKLADKAKRVTHQTTKVNFLSNLFSKAQNRSMTEDSEEVFRLLPNGPVVLNKERNDESEEERLLRQGKVQIKFYGSSSKKHLETFWRF